MKPKLFGDCSTPTAGFKESVTVPIGRAKLARRNAGEAGPTASVKQSVISAQYLECHNYLFELRYLAFEAMYPKIPVANSSTQLRSATQDVLKGLGPKTNLRRRLSQ